MLKMVIKKKDCDETIFLYNDYLKHMSKGYLFMVGARVGRGMKDRRGKNTRGDGIKNFGII